MHGAAALGLAASSQNKLLAAGALIAGATLTGDTVTPYFYFGDRAQQLRRR